MVATVTFLELFLLTFHLYIIIICVAKENHPWCHDRPKRPSLVPCCGLAPNCRAIFDDTVYLFEYIPAQQLGPSVCRALVPLRSALRLLPVSKGDEAHGKPQYAVMRPLESRHL